MGTITINISDETEQKFRQKVRETFGEGKGKLGQAVEKMMDEWVEEEEYQKLMKEAIAMLKKGLYKLPKDYKFRREEAYESRYRKITGTN